MFKLIIVLSLLFSLPIQAAQPLDIVINEIAWMGTKASSADEWIELYNNTNQDIDLNDWSLYEDQTLIISLTNTIEAFSYYLIERTDDSTISNIEASQEPTGWGGYGLNNNGEHLKLLDQNLNIIDEVNCSEGWFAGDKSLFKTMERINLKETGLNQDNWQTNNIASIGLDADNNPIQGTPKEENNQTVKEQTSEEIESYSFDIIINEVLPYPEGPDSENEWIELKNLGNQDIDLESWKIKDTEGSTKTYTFPKETIIKANSFLILPRPETKITLNNDRDGIELIHPNDNIVNSVYYEQSSLGYSYSLIESDWFWSSQPTPNAENLIIEEKITKTENNKYLDINQKNIKKNNDFLSIFLKAVLTAISSSLIVFRIKKTKINLISNKK